MKILALDTSSITATVAVLEGEKLLGEYILNHKLTHSQKLIPMVEELLRSCELKPSDIDVFAVSLGPGSFTGLRIGATTIKAMAQALSKPVVGIPTLEGLAYNLPFSSEYICPMIDAQKNMVYSALYFWSGSKLQVAIPQEVFSIEKLLGELMQLGKRVIFIGDAVEKHKEALAASLGELAIFPPAFVRMPRAASVAALAAEKLKMGEAKAAGDILPIYMRKSQAESQYEERRRAKGRG
jgi:tRNA threonylcarbamoyladenosine biosynthesis protein TsaB